MRTEEQKTKNNIAAKKYYALHKEERLAYALEYRTINKEKIRDHRKQRDLRQPDILREKDRAYRVAHKEELRAYNMMRYHGVTTQEIEELKIKQNNKCAICNKELVPGRGTHLDHNHITNKNRGLLCSTCNTGIGGLRDDPKIILNAYKYLLKWSE